MTDGAVYVIDASAVVAACVSEGGFDVLLPHTLRSPALLWSESTSVLHQLRWRRAISEELADNARKLLAEAPVTVEQRTDLHDEAWRVADELGWAKTYEAEYVALARLLGCPLITLDARLQRGAGRLVEMCAPDELDR